MEPFGFDWPLIALPLAGTREFVAEPDRQIAIDDDADVWPPTNEVGQVPLQQFTRFNSTLRRRRRGVRP